MIRDALRAIGDAPFLCLPDGTEESGTETLSKLDVQAAWLSTFDAAPGDVIALHGLGRADLLRMLLACLAEGLGVWPLSYRDPPEVIQAQLRESRARFVVSGTSDCLATRDDTEARWQLGEPGEPGTLLRTSGTTGAAKLAFHRLDSHVQSAQSAIRATDFRAGDTWLLSLPLFHVGGLSIVFRALAARGRIAIPAANVSTEVALVDLAPTHISVVATQLFRILSSPAARAAAAKCTCVLAGGGPVPATLRASVLDAGIPLAVCYGSTETAAFVAASRDPDIVRTPTSAGRVLEGRDVTLAPDGEILVGGPTVFAGYLSPDGLDDTRDAEGRHQTGDLGRLDADGVLYVLGRRDRMFISGGENVQPEEIEGALEDLPGIERAIVVELFDDEFGRRPVAFLQVEPAFTLTARGIETQLRETLAGFKIPDAFWHLPTRMRPAPKPDLPGLVAMAADPEEHFLEAL